MYKLFKESVQGGNLITSLAELKP